MPEGVHDGHQVEWIHWLDEVKVEARVPDAAAGVLVAHSGHRNEYQRPPGGPCAEPDGQDVPVHARHVQVDQAHGGQELGCRDDQGALVVSRRAGLQTP